MVKRAVHALFVAALFVALVAVVPPGAWAQGQVLPGQPAPTQPVPPKRPPQQQIPLQDLLQQMPPHQGDPRLRGSDGARPAVPPPAQARKPEPPKGPPPLPTDPAKRLEALFERLRDAENVAAAKKAEIEIDKIFERSGSATADLMFERAKLAFVTKDFPLALDLLDYVTTLKPDFAEAYHRRAMVHVLQKDEEAALRDLKLTLGRQPRHFHALAGLAMVLQALGDKKGAYRALTRVRELNPHFPDIAEQLEKLKLDAEGQPI